MNQPHSRMTTPLFTVLTTTNHPGVQIPDDSIQSRARWLSKALDVPLTSSDNQHSARFAAVYNETGRLELRFGQDSSIKPIQSGIKLRRNARGADPLLRAIGSERCEIVDATAGFGLDVASLVIAGHRVIAVEEHPLLYAFLVDGLVHLNNPQLASRTRLVHADSIDWLGTLSRKVDVIYLDPMYPPHQRKGASKKGIRFLQEIIPYNPGRDRTLLKIARHRASRRVIVKRPLYADPLLPGKSGETKGKLVRFDIYPPDEE